jgi:peptidoglycan DL-endopeptidase CwlO
MARLTLPARGVTRFVRIRGLSRLSALSRSSALLIAAFLVLTLGTGATAITAALVSSSHAAAAGAATVPTSTPTTSGALPPISVGPVQALLPTGSPSTHTSQVSSRPHTLVSATLLVSGKGLTRHDLRKLRHLSGVRKIQTISAGRAKVDGHSAFVVGVNPSSFRPWTPKLTADSQALWNSVSNGDLTASFDMGHDANLPLGQTVPVDDKRGSTPIRIGAFASVGMAGVDAVVSQTRASQLGLHPNSGVLISAPKADPLQLRKAAQQVAGKHVNVDLLREVIITRDAGEFLTRTQILNFLNAAKSRIGLPYVWGATGPSSFDCSGLVQWSFAQAGIRMPRVSEEQWLTGPHIPYQDARPGDLLFWHYDPTDPTNIDHVAIYWGNGMMVVAPHTGLNVQYVPVPLSNLAGVVRVDPTIAAELA